MLKNLDHIAGRHFVQKLIKADPCFVLMLHGMFLQALTHIIFCQSTMHHYKFENLEYCVSFMIRVKWIMILLAL